MMYSNILLIDDDSDDHEFFQEALKQISDQLIYNSADNGKKALDLIEEKKVNPDLIFLDWNMPIMNGQQFLEERMRRDILGQTPIIIFSTSSHLSTIELSQKLGAHRFITKPNNFPELVSILSSIIKNESF